IQRQAFGRVQFATRNDKHFAHSAIDMNSQHLQVRAAIRFATSAGDAATAIEVRLDRAAVAGFHVLCRTTHRYDLDAKFVTKDSREAEKRLPSIEGVDVGAADADAANAYQRFPRLDRRGERVFG